ncbi:peptide chain release factor 2 [Candidatus Berkelbacteria bacterium CG10_big_fil_rev_8_21_14_0_10_41_12]|uniref:Peptide chain release factor 2 n=1 Tax=Candidatus Berkelbacteria bacterium CG10_big_fil_rev_8_21_14_0_10_41_12 TaxID=1974513 RepID=A0A2M6WWU0_9BACT|nr:MAG: peptide chain release factor 2 [Candidatus Berkelbacteria bacterium CG10_big_fil_rev_8_21_14_0_10_41_12]
MEKDELAKLLKIDEKKEELKSIEDRMSESDFWSDRDNSSTLSSRYNYLLGLVRKFENAVSREDLELLKKETLYSGEYDNNDAIISIHSGAGGTEAQDWAEMIMRMLMRYAQKNKYEVVIFEKSPGEEAGIKSATLGVRGPNAYGNSKSEGGVHRLVRISPYDADKARHTSFALVEVVPEFEEVKDVEIDEKDLKIDTFHSSGHGGQSVNTTNSAVRVTHLPSRIVVTVQNERSQLQNKETAIKILKVKLLARQLEQKKEEEAKIKGEHISAEWGNQIRSYILQPYQLVRDHRTGYEQTNPQVVLNGDLDGFISAYLKKFNS